MSYRTRIKQTAGTWKRKCPTGFVRPQRNFFRAKMRQFRKLQKALKQQMIHNLAERNIGPGVSSPDTDKPDVTELF